MVIVDANSDECVSSASSTQSFVRVSATICCVLLEGRAVFLMSVSMSESSSINSVSTTLASLSFRLLSSTNVSRANSFSLSFRRIPVSFCRSISRRRNFAISSSRLR